MTNEIVVGSTVVDSIIESVIDAKTIELQNAIQRLGVNKVARKYGYRAMYHVKSTSIENRKVNILVEISTRPDENGNFWVRLDGATYPTRLHATDPRFEKAYIVPSITWYAYADSAIENGVRSVQGIERVQIRKSYVTHVKESGVTLAQYVNTEKTPDTWKALELPANAQKNGLTVSLLESVLTPILTKFTTEWNLPDSKRPPYEDKRQVILDSGKPLNPLAFAMLPDTTRTRLQKAWDEKHGITRLPQESADSGSGTALNPDGSLKVESPEPQA